jgi:photosystem II protein PsbQ
MRNLRSILSVILVLVTTLLVSCGSPQVTQIPPTYSPEKIEQLQVFVEPIEAARDKMGVLQEYIAKRNWVDTRNVIHGPLGQLRQNMLGLSRSLLPKDEPKASALAKELFGHFERIDAAAKDRNATVAENQYREALKDFDAFLDLIPSAS